VTSPEDFKVILRERAGRLSRPVAEPPKDLKRIVIFSVGRELYGLEIKNVYEIFKADSVTFVPGAEPYIQGVTNLRGEIVTVIDLQSLLMGKPRQDTAAGGQMIVGEYDGGKLGLVVTDIDGIHDIQAELIDPPLTTLERLRAEHLIGEFKFGNRIVGLLDAASILEHKGA
jgi:chemotaxis signal transduction protein